MGTHLLALLVLTAACTRPQAPPVTSADEPRDLLLITVDTLRADRMGAYGGEHDATPVFDALARQGALFERAYAQRGSTWPSLVSIMTSLHPTTHGVRANGQPLPGAPTALADLLAARGYRCGAVLTNASELGWSGFEDVLPVMEEPRDVLAADRALEWLELEDDRPFFLWVHFVAPHDPYQPPPEHRRFVAPHYQGYMDGSIPATTRLLFGEAPIEPADRAQLLALYDGEVAWTDAQMGRIVDRLRDGSRLDDTLIVVSADHGEELLDRHRYPFHNASVYEGTLRIPLLFRLPGRVPSGTRHDDLVASLDIAPTVLDLMGFPEPEGFQGRSLRPALEGNELPARAVFSELEDKVLTLRDERERWVWNPGGYSPPLVPSSRIQQAGFDHGRVRNTLPIRTLEHYRTDRDPLEQHDLTVGAAPDPTVLQRFHAFQSLYGWVLDGAGEPPPMDPALREQLEAMGYVVP